jgi:glucose-6-phosphate 1-epimerase
MINSIKSNEFGSVSEFVLDSAQQVFGLNIQHLSCQASISLLGGQLLTWQPTGTQPVFWLSETAIYQPGKAIRGGIPICWPWFGGYQQAGNHGFARQSSWQLESVNLTAHHVELTLVLAGAQSHPLWPAAFELRQLFVLGEQLQHSLVMQNRSTQTVHYSGALHNYIRVSKPENIRIPDLVAVEYDDKLTGTSQLQQEEVSCIGPIDRVYHSTKTMRMLDSQWHRTIELVSEQCQQWVLWNPGIAESNHIIDVHEHGAQQFVCLEAANTQWQQIPAGQSRTIGQTIRVISNA